MEYLYDYTFLTKQNIFDYTNYKKVFVNNIYNYVNNIEENEYFNNIYNYVNNIEVTEYFNNIYNFSKILIDDNPILFLIMNFIMCYTFYVLIDYLINYIFGYENNNKENEANLVLEDTINGVTCLKVPKVFSIVAKEYFKTDTNIYLTFVGKLSLGRYLSKKIVPKDMSSKFLTDTDPVTKKTFRFIRYTKDDYKQMKKYTKEWITYNKDKWVHYFAY